MKFIIFTAFTTCSLLLGACKTIQAPKTDKDPKVVQQKIKCSHCAGANTASDKTCQWCGAPLEKD